MMGLRRLTLAERKVIGCRSGSARTVSAGKGLLQPIADGIKLMLKEIIRAGQGELKPCSSWSV